MEEVLSSCPKRTPGFHCRALPVPVFSVLPRQDPRRSRNNKSQRGDPDRPKNDGKGGILDVPSKVSGAASSRRQPNFAKQLRVQPNNLRGEEHSASQPGKLPSILQNKSGIQQQPKAPAQTFLRPISATQSNLSGPAAATPSLVEFFQKKLEDANRDVYKNDQKERPNLRNSLTRSNYPSIREDGPPKQIAPLRPPPSAERTFGLDAAVAQARIAQSGIDLATPQDPKGGVSPKEDALAKTTDVRSRDLHRNSGNINSSIEPISPIRQFIRELQEKKSSQRQPKDKQEKHNLEEKEVPTWRTTSRNIAESRRERQQMIDPLFSSRSQHIGKQPQHQHQNDDILDRQPEEGRPQPSTPKIVKVKEIILPLHDVTLAELSALFRVKAQKLKETIQELGENPRDDDAYTVGEYYAAY
jgi:hypothetical protein